MTSSKDNVAGATQSGKGKTAEDFPCCIAAGSIAEAILGKEEKESITKGALANCLKAIGKPDVLKHYLSGLRSRLESGDITRKEAARLDWEIHETEHGMAAGRDLLLLIPDDWLNEVLAEVKRTAVLAPEPTTILPRATPFEIAMIQRSLLD